MRIIDRQDFKMNVSIKSVLYPSSMKAVTFTREEYDKDDKIIRINSYEFFLDKDDLKLLARVFDE
jgi:hypothetical protein